MQPGITIYNADGKAQGISLKTLLRIPMSSFRPTRQFERGLISEMLRAANGAKRGPGHHLDALLRSWVNGECNLEKWAIANEGKFSALRQTCNQWRIQPFEGLVPDRGHFKPTLTGPIGLDASAETRDHPGERVACDMFAVFVLTCADVTRIGICDRCGNLYSTGRRKLNKRFCSRTCARRQSVKERQAEVLAEERRAKNTRIMQGITKIMERKPVMPNWKAWVVGQSGVTRSYLTRTLNRGLRGEPDGLKLTKRQREYLKLEAKGA
jgi:hypothetical protein